jgi:hypothetical protein
MPQEAPVTANRALPPLIPEKAGIQRCASWGMLKLKRAALDPGFRRDEREGRRSRFP